jgi:erythromycin esterase
MGQSVLSYEIVKRSVPFTDRQDFADLLEMCADKQVVMLGESTHGTREFYEWRSLLTAELIQKHGFNFVAVEGDWPACEGVNRFIQRKTHERSFDSLRGFSRWPTWMWANHEMVKMMDWLREYNLNASNSVGFHGLDVYSLYESIDVVIDHLEDINPDLALKVKDYYSCFEPYREDEKAYARSLFQFPAGCEREVTQALKEILEAKLKDHSNQNQFFNIQQNAQIVQNAERYYRSLLFEVGDNSWNIRDQHMMDTLDLLLDQYGKGSKAIIWAHNTHIGDYRGTDMGVRGNVNLGGLARERRGEDNVSLVGFTTYKGSVVASHAWDGPVEVMEVPEAKTGSLEAVLHDLIPQVGHENYYMIFNEVEEYSPLLDFRGHRAIGVVYQGHPEARGHYVPTSVARRYDALVFFDETQALSPLDFKFNRHKMPETYPFGARI